MKDKRGRPTEYNPRFARWAGALARNGKTKKDIAEMMDIAVSTLALWEEQHVEFSEAISTGRRMADAEVEDSLFRRATGYDYEEKERNVLAQKGGGTVVRTRTVTRHVPADTKAMIFWLKTRRAREWTRDDDY